MYLVLVFLCLYEKASDTWEMIFIRKRRMLLGKRKTRKKKLAEPAQKDRPWKKGHEWEIQNRTICMDGLQ